jgi:phage baseplate assembly protein W
MMTTDLLALIEGADTTFTYEQFRTWVVAQSVRNALETFHGDWAFDPDNPGSGEGFISDDQMRALNITIRRAVHEALGQVDLACNIAKETHRRGPCTGEQAAALEFCEFQLRTIRDYMEAPGSPELEQAYQRYVSEPDVNR